MAVFHHKKITETSPGSASTVASSGLIQDLADYQWFTVDAALQGATGGTLDVYIQRDVDGTWVDWLHLPQLSAGASAVRYVLDARDTETPPVAVGSGTTPSLAAGKLACMHPGDKARLLFVAGAGTTAGAAQTVTITCWRLAGS